MNANSQAPVAEVNKHGFDDACAPRSETSHFQIGFSLGVFQWVPKSGGKGLKKSAVKVRVKGFVSNAGCVYDKAREICLKVDASETISQKSISV